MHRVKMRPCDAVGVSELKARSTMIREASTFLVAYATALIVLFGWAIPSGLDALDLTLVPFIAAVAVLALPWVAGRVRRRLDGTPSATSVRRPYDARLAAGSLWGCVTWPAILRVFLPPVSSTDYAPTFWLIGIPLLFVGFGMLQLVFAGVRRIPDSFRPIGPSPVAAVAIVLLALGALAPWVWLALGREGEQAYRIASQVEMPGSGWVIAIFLAVLGVCLAAWMRGRARSIFVLGVVVYAGFLIGASTAWQTLRFDPATTSETAVAMLIIHVLSAALLLSALAVAWAWRPRHAAEAPPDSSGDTQLASNDGLLSGLLQRPGPTTRFADRLRRF
jgi:hypothetical protein